MNKTIIYQIEFFNYWHSGSGLAGSTYADSIVNKTEGNLPFIPGKTLKGLLRDAAENINRLNDEFIDSSFINKIFGRKPEKDTMEDEKVTMEDEGVSFFTNAYLSHDLSFKILNSNNKLSNSLYHVLSSTEIDEDGQATDGSLRQLEVTIPLTLYASIEDFPEKYLPQLQFCFGWIKEMGQNRNRGLGKCKISILKD